MKSGNDNAKWSPDEKINWGGSLLIVVLANYFLILLKSLGIVDLGNSTWWIGTAIGSVLAAAFNWLRPRYDIAGRFWKPLYRFLLEQMSPPD